MEDSHASCLLEAISSPALVLSTTKIVLAANAGFERLTGLPIHPNASGAVVGRSVDELGWAIVPISKPVYREWDSLIQALQRRARGKLTSPVSPTLTRYSLRSSEHGVRRGSRDLFVTEEFWDSEEKHEIIEEIDVFVNHHALSSELRKISTMTRCRMRVKLCEVGGQSVYLVDLRRPPTHLPPELRNPAAAEDEDALAAPLRAPWTPENLVRDGLIENQDDVHSIIDRLLPHVLAILDDKGEVEYLSPSWYHYTALTETQSLGSEWVQVIHPDDMPEMMKAWGETVEGRLNHWSWEARYRRFDGEYNYFLVCGQPLKADDGSVVKWFCSMLNVNDLVSARIESDRKKKSILSVLSHADISLWAVDQFHHITSLEGTLIWDTNVLIKYGDASGNSSISPDVLEPLQKVLDGHSELEIVEHQVNGRWYRTRFVADDTHDAMTYDYASGVESALGLTIDITDVKARAMLQMENERLITNEHAAQAANKLKSRFLANMSHEIRTPIGGIMGLNDLLLDSDLNDEQHELAHGIKQSAAFLLTIINDILDFSKIESGHMDIERVPFNLSEVIMDLYRLMDVQAKRKGLRLQYSNALPADRDLVGDPGRIRQVLTNLLSNSIKFTDSGSVSLSVTVMPPDFQPPRRRERSSSPALFRSSTSSTTSPSLFRQASSSESEDMSNRVVLHFLVEDTGIGIGPESMKKLFQPFLQADSSTARLHGGTGLGLNICKQLVRLMGGEIELASKPNLGTKASFYVPFLISIGPTRPSEYSMDQHTKDPRAERPDFFSPASLSRANLRDARDAAMNSRSGFPQSGSPPRPVISLPTDLRKHDVDVVMTMDSRPITPTNVQASTKPHILIVEDNAINQKIALKTVTKLNYTASSVWNGHEALIYLSNLSSSSHTLPNQAANQRPDIILMDCMMPVMDGYEATSIIRGGSRRGTQGMEDEGAYAGEGMWIGEFGEEVRRIPIVAMTASALKGDRERCEGVGMDDYLTKPIVKGSLEGVLKKWLERSGRS